MLNFAPFFEIHSYSDIQKYNYTDIQKYNYNDTAFLKTPGLLSLSLLVDIQQVDLAIEMILRGSWCGWK